GSGLALRVFVRHPHLEWTCSARGGPAGFRLDCSVGCRASSGGRGCLADFFRAVVFPASTSASFARLIFHYSGLTKEKFMKLHIWLVLLGCVAARAQETVHFASV